MASPASSHTTRYICKSCRHAISRPKRRRFGTSTLRQSDLDIYDVVTVGGGPVGLAILAALKSSPTTRHLRTLLVEPQSLSTQHSWTLPPTTYSNRASSITPTNAAFLHAIGSWRHLDATRIQDYDSMQVWDASHSTALTFDWTREAAKYNAPPRTIATMVENANLSRSLLERIHELGAQESLREGVKVQRIENGSDEAGGLDLSSWPVLTLEAAGGAGGSAEMRKVAARLLIGADGLNSPVRTFAGITTTGWDYGRHGVVATLKLAPSATDDAAGFDGLFAEDGPGNRATAYQRFIPALGGPIAVLPLPDNHASLVWSTTPQNAAYLKTLGEGQLVSMLNAALRLREVDLKFMATLPPTGEQNDHEEELVWRMPHTPSPEPAFEIPTVEAVQPKSLASFPLRLRNATSYTGPHVALAGDAAHTIHPLAGQGLNLGLGDAEALVRAVEWGVEHGACVGSEGVLGRYSAERYGKVLSMVMGVDGMEKMYRFGGGLGAGLGTEGIGAGALGSLIAQARGLGMKAFGAVPGLKEFVMRRAE